MGWVPGGTIDTLAVHAALLPSGRIIYFGGSDYNPYNHDHGLINHSRLFDCATLNIIATDSPTTDVFCCGHSLIAGGRLLVAGGTAAYALGTGPGIHHDHWPGIADAWLYDDRVSRWIKLASMHGGRWYPTLITLSDGRVLASSGHPSASDTRHINNTPEIYDASPNRWTLLNALGDQGREFIPNRDPGFQVQYPRMHVLPSGEIFIVTPLYEHEPSSLRYNPDLQQHVFVGGTNSDPDFLPAALVNGHNTTSVLLPFLGSRGQRSSVLLCGSRQPLRIDLDDPEPAWRATGPRAYQLALANGTLAVSPLRYNLSAVILPTGDVFVCGGVNDPDQKRDQFGVLAPEVYHPETDQWEKLEFDDAKVVRNYHSVALLMPDGRVWTAGSNHDGNPGDTAEPAVRIYEPWYHFRPRPLITQCPDGMNYRRAASDDFSFGIQTTSAASITRVAIIRAGSSTHAFNPDQRYVELEFRVLGATEIGATPPASGGIAPPGDYLLFILDQNNVPSKGKFVWVGEPPPPLPGVTPPRVSQPFAIHNQDGRIELFVVGADGAIYHRWQTAPNGPFADWHSLGGNVSQPFAIRNQDDRIELFAVGAGSDRALWHRWQTAPNGPFADWDSLGGDINEPFAIHNQDGRIEVFAINADGAVWHRWQTAPNGPSADWDRLG